MQTIEMWHPQGFNQVSRKNGGRAWREAGPGNSRGCVDLEDSQKGHTSMRFLGLANYYREFINGYTDKVYPMQ